MSAQSADQNATQRAVAKDRIDNLPAPTQPRSNLPILLTEPGHIPEARKKIAGPLLVALAAVNGVDRTTSSRRWRPSARNYGRKSFKGGWNSNFPSTHPGTICNCTAAGPN